MRRLAPVVAAVLVLGGALVIDVPTAFAGVDHRCIDPTTCTIGVDTPGSSTSIVPTANNPTPTGSASSGPCPTGQVPTYTVQTQGGQPAQAQPGDVDPITGAPVAPGSEMQVIYCNGAYLTTVIIPPGGGAAGSPGITGAQLAQQAVASFEVKPPTPQLAPSTSLVGVSTWLWLHGGWSSSSATAAVPGLSATVTASPSQVVWDMGDGNETVCDGPGRPWDANQPDATSDCTYTYPAAGQFTVTVTVYYRTSWTASNGTAGQLPAVSGRTTVPVTVDEMQAVNTN